MFFMAIVDNVALLRNICANLAALLSPVNQHNQKLICKAYVFLRGLCVGSSSLLILLMSCERVFASYAPFTYKDNVTTKLLSKIGTGAIVITGLFSMMSSTIYSNEKGRCFSLDENVNENLAIAAVLSTTIIFFVGPSISALILNVLIIIFFN